MACSSRASQSVVNIFREKCNHGPSERYFDVIDYNLTFEKFESKFRCNIECPNTVFLAENECGPWTELGDSMYEMGVGSIFSSFPNTKYIKLICMPPEQEDSAEITNHQQLQEPPRNAFAIMKAAGGMLWNKDGILPDKKESSSGVKVGLSRKDELFNDIISWMTEKGVRFTNKENANYITQALNNTLWYLTNQHETINDRSRREKAVSPIPATFDRFQGYNEHKRKKLKSQPLASDQLKKHAEILLSISLQPIMQSTVKWTVVYENIKALAQCLLSYTRYLDSKNELFQTYSKLDHPVRQVAENVTVTCVKGAGLEFEVRQTFNLLEKAMALADMYEPVFFDENTHLENPFESSLQRLRFFETLQLSCTLYIYKYCPGGSIVTTFCLVKVPETASEAEIASQLSVILLKIKPKLPEYHTRLMKRQFKEKIKNVVSVQGSVLDMMYKELAYDASAGSHPDTLQRIRAMALGEPGLVADMRQLNPGRPSGEFDCFFEKLGEIVEGYTAADERRHNIAHMSQILSVRDLIDQTTEQCPEGTKIPSAALVRLQFSPRNPYAHSAMNFTGKIPVQYKVQRRQLRVSHIDDHYCSALFKYMRTLAIKLKPHCALLFCDDKAKVPIGEPDVAVSTGVRGKVTIAPTKSVLGAADHDLHQKTSLTPSVYMSCSIPDTVDKSFYRGKVFVTVNDSITQQSNPMRHACALLKIINEMETKPSVLLKYTDGGTDHRCNLEFVKCAAICLFKDLDLDFYVAARCAPGHSWTNPAERVMSILNIGLQNVALSREKMAEDNEKVIGKCTSMDAIRQVIKGKPELKQVWLDSVEPVRQCVENRFRRLVLKDEPISVRDPVREDEIDYLSRHLNFLFPGLDTNNLVKSHTKKVDSYNQWIEKHCQVRNYSFQIRKCDDVDCCSPPQNHYDWLPDPMEDENNAYHYRSFENVYGKDTDESDRPSLKNQLSAAQNAKAGTKKVKAVTDPLVSILPDDPVLRGYAGFTAQQARYVIACTECDKPRLIYSKFRLSERQSVQMITLLSEHDYVCGAPVTIPESNLHGKIFTRLNIDCSSAIETSYYSADLDQRQDVCYYCGHSGAERDETLKSKFKSVHPICGQCRGKGLKYPCTRPKHKEK